MKLNLWGLPTSRLWHAEPEPDDVPEPIPGPPRHSAPDTSPSEAVSEPVDRTKDGPAQMESTASAPQMTREEWGRRTNANGGAAPSSQRRDPPPAPLPDDHLTPFRHCNGRHDGGERCDWCDAVTDMATDLRQTRQRVSALEAAVDELLRAGRSTP
ncbi:hypothetical protein AGRA3207_007503 [Actinomadura graeca]|uniref:Uncharacterized protein n=1 Tax=Actinomadura graeca TaxID=2750812 RepID=A0ABX8R4E8_9ACTN|nr:hypothetical protein [Actinomadura graeca]QXJ25934.1 hypothetical protein AGRA3207_007503 [Actinomadura graeca]